MDPVFAVDLFIDALTDPQQRLHVECGKPANLQEALHLTQVWENAHRSESARQYRHSKSVRERQVIAGDEDVDQPNESRVVHENKKKSGQIKKKSKAMETVADEKAKERVMQVSQEYKKQQHKEIGCEQSKSVRQKFVS